MNTLKEVFEYHLRTVKIDNRLAERIYSFERNFVNKNQSHVEFFSNNLLGVVKVIFSPSDYARWYDEVLDIDDIALTQDIGELPTINTEFNVASDTFYLTSVMLCSFVAQSNLSVKIKHQTMLAILMVMQYKMITSNLANYFKYQADREVMEAVKEAMSNKYLIKKFGNWHNLFKFRAEELISGIHKQSILTGKPDEKVIYAITDTKTRITNLVKNHWELLKVIRAKDSKITDSKIYFQTEDGKELSDLRRDVSVYRVYIHSVIGISDSFIKEELIGFLDDIMAKWSSPLFTTVLVDFSKEYNDSDKLRDLVNEILTHAFDYLYDKVHLTHNSNIDYPFILYKLKGIYQSSKASDPRLLSIRDSVSNFIIKSNKKRGRKSSEALVASLRTGFMLYIILRTLTRRRYS